MSAPFRDLFVELPRAVFEALQGIGEAAVARELAVHDVSRAARRPSMASTLMSSPIAAALCKRYGWSRCEWSRAEERAESELRAHFSCGHRQSISIRDEVLEDARDVVGVIFGLLDTAARACYCVQPREAPR